MDVIKKAKTFTSLLSTPTALAQVLRDKYRRMARVVVLPFVRPNVERIFYGSLKQRIKARYRIMFHRKPNLRRPQLWTEKAQWRKLYCPQVELLGQVTDKVGVYEYVRERIGDKHLLPIIWVGDTFTPDDLRNLGDGIVLQPTHRSGQVAFIEKAEYVDYEALSGLLHRMLAWPYSMCGQEPWYGRIKPQIVARPLITNSEGSPFLNDCKFHIFKQPDGSTKVICEIINTYPHWRAIFDESYERLPFDWSPNQYPPPSVDPPKPEQFEAMLADAYELAADFDYVRVDFMMGAQEYYFSELTFAPAGGRPQITPSCWDEVVGSYWHLDIGNPVKRFFWKCRAWLPLWRTERPMRNLRRLYRYRDDWAISGMRPKHYDLRHRNT